MQPVTNPYDPGHFGTSEQVIQAVKTYSSPSFLKGVAILWCSGLFAVSSLIFAVRVAMTVPLPW